MSIINSHLDYDSSQDQDIEQSLIDELINDDAELINLINNINYSDEFLNAIRCCFHRDDKPISAGMLKMVIQKEAIEYLMNNCALTNNQGC